MFSPQRTLLNEPRRKCFFSHLWYWPILFGGCGFFLVVVVKSNSSVIMSGFFSEKEPKQVIARPSNKKRQCPFVLLSCMPMVKSVQRDMSQLQTLKG